MPAAILPLRHLNGFVVIGRKKIEAPGAKNRGRKAKKVEEASEC
jgi:hypothetical protein